MSRKREKPPPWWRAAGVWATRFRQVVIAVRYNWVGMPIDCHVSPAGAYPRGATWQEVEIEVMKMLQKPSNRNVAGAAGHQVEPCELALNTPTLYEYLTQTAWEDGTAREPSGLLIFYQDGFLKAMLRDRDSGLCLWVTAKSLTALFATLEAGLLDPDAVWKMDRQQPGQTARRVKK